MDIQDLLSETNFTIEELEQILERLRFIGLEGPFPIFRSNLELMRKKLKFMMH